MKRLVLAALALGFFAEAAAAGEGQGLFGGFFRRRWEERREARRAQPRLAVEARRARPEDYQQLRIWTYHYPQPRLLGIPHESQTGGWGLHWRGTSYTRNPLADYREYDDGYYGGPDWVKEVEVLRRDRYGRTMVWRRLWREVR